MSSKLLTVFGGAKAAVPEIVTDGLLAEWRMDDGSGQVVTDYSGNGYHLQLGSTADAGGDANDPTWSAEGLTFATDDYCTSTEAALRPAAFTVMTVYADSAADLTACPIIGWGTTGTSPVLYSRFLTNNLSTMYVNYSGDDDWIKHLYPEAINDGSYRVITQQCPGTSLANVLASTVYLNKTSCSVDSSQADSNWQAKTDFFLGRDGKNVYLNGKIAAVLMYNRVLTSEEVEQNVDYLSALLGVRGLGPFDDDDPVIGLWTSGHTVSVSPNTSRVSSWTNEVSGGPVLNMASGGAYHKARAGVPWIEILGFPSLSTTIEQPFDVYFLLYRNERSDITIIDDQSLYLFADGTSSASINSATGALTVNGAAVVGVTVGKESWQRIQIHIDGAASYVRVEDDYSSLFDAGSNDLAGTIYVLSSGSGESTGIHAWVPYIRAAGYGIGTLSNDQVFSEMSAESASLNNWNSTLVVADDAHNGFPGYVILADGTEIMCYRKGTDHVTARDGIVVMRSRADSESEWSAESTILDQTATAGNDGDTRDASIMVTSTGRLICTGFTGAGSDVWCCYSDDDGATWSAKVVMGETFSGSACSTPAVEIGGKLYQLIYNTSAPTDIGMCVSEDDGETWSADDFILVAEGTEDYSLNEASVIVVDGEWCVLSRATDSNIHLFTSSDSGANWVNQGTVFRGVSRVALCELGDGRILAVYRGTGEDGELDHDFARLYSRTSSDSLRTWTDPVAIKPHHAETEYAAVQRRSDGTVCVVASFQVMAQEASIDPELPEIIGADIHYFERNEDDL